MQVFLLGGGENISAWYSKRNACYKHAQRGGSRVCPPDYFVKFIALSLNPMGFGTYPNTNGFSYIIIIHL